MGMTCLGFTVLTILSIILAAEDISANGDTLKQVSLVVRHGERAPREPYRSSPNPKQVWPDGFNELTLTGKLHMFELGQFMRSRYSNLIGNKTDLNVMSSSIQRCILSAQAMLAGLVPVPVDQPIPDLDWQPVPVRFLPPHKDDLILLEKPCPRLEEEIQNVMTSKDVEELTKTSADLFQYLSEHSGETVNDIHAAMLIYDALRSEKEHGYRIPDWAENVFPEKLQVMDAKYRSLFTQSNESKRLRGGPLLRNITSHMKEKVNETDAQKGSVYLYAVHDQTIIDVLRTLGFDALVHVDFGSCLIFELHQKGNMWTVAVRTALALR